MGLLSGPPQGLPFSTAFLFTRSWLEKKGLSKHLLLVALLSSAYFSFTFTLRKCHCGCLCLWVKPFVAGARVLFTVLFSFHLLPPPNLLVISRPDFTACTLLLPTSSKKVEMQGKEVRRGREKTGAPSRNPRSLGTFPHFLLAPYSLSPGLSSPSSFGRAPTQVCTGRSSSLRSLIGAEAGSGLPCETGISGTAGERLCVAVCHFILQFLNQ